MAFKDSDEFFDEEHLLSADEKSRDSSSARPRAETSRARFLPFSIALNFVLALAVGLTWMLATRPPRQPYIPNEVYSPAKSAVEYQTVVFTGGLHGDKSAYQGSSDKVNAAWEALYNGVGISQIPAHQASRLPNATTPTAHDPTQYMVELDVFHQLHCLNLMRKLVYPQVFSLDLTSGSDEAEDNVYHMEHCYDQLRQSIQCASDVGTIYWEWSEQKHKMFGNLRTTHTCKNFDKIHAWALEHQLEEEFDWFKQVVGAPIRHID